MSLHAGIKANDKADLCIVASTSPCASAAMFTRNQFCGPSVVVGRAHAECGQLRAVVVTSGIANVATGEEGLRNAKAVATLTAKLLEIEPTQVLPSSTGVIGWQLPMEKVLAGIEKAVPLLRAGNLLQASEGILTTDPRPKCRSIVLPEGSVIFGMVKGAGMIEPNMATMLAYFFTDAAVDNDALKPIFERAVHRSLNMLSVDTDTSTSDTVAILANGQSGSVDLSTFEQALTSLMIELTKDIARDAEGATKLIEARVRSARSFEQAKRVAKSIINSPLVKTAVYGCDPNWGRVAMAVGKTFDLDIRPETVSIAFGPHLVYHGKPLLTPGGLEPVREYLNNAHIVIEVHLGVGDEQATAWGCDLTEGYIHINGSYTS